MIDPVFLLIQGLNGLAQAMILFLIASGLSLIFGVLRILNFAHGSLYMLGGYFTYTVVADWVGRESAFWAAAVLAALAVGLLGGGIERFLLRPIYGRDQLSQILLTYALVLIISDLAKLTWGTDYRSLGRPPLLAGSIPVFGQSFPLYSVFLIGLGPLVALALWAFLERTRLGRLVRAAAHDWEMVDALGVSVSRLYTGTFIAGAALAGLGGALAAPLSTVAPGADVELIVESFIVVVIGGLGSLWGSLLGAVILGQVTAFGLLLIPRFELVFIYGLMAVVLVVRPWGLLGRPLTK